MLTEDAKVLYPLFYNTQDQKEPYQFFLLLLLEMQL